MVVYSRILGEDRDAPFPLQVGVVHHPLGDALVGPEEPTLGEHRVDKGRLPMVDVRDDGDVSAQGVGYRRSGFLERRHLYSIPGKA